MSLPRAARAPWLPAVLMAVMAAIVLWNSAHKSMWTDEAYSLNTAMRPLAGTIHQALHFELQPPVYFVLLNGWLRLHAGIEFARLLSLACALGTVGTLVAIGRLLGFRGWLAPATLAAVTPGLIWAAAEARVYALSLFLASVTLYCFLRLLRSPPEKVRRAAVIYAIVAYLSVLVFYYNGFLLLGQWIAALATGQRPRAVTLAMAFVGLGLLPWTPTILSQRATHPIEIPASEVAASVPRRVFVTAGVPIKAFLTDTEALYLPHAIVIIWAVLVLIPVVRLVASRAPVDTDEWVLALSTLVPLVSLLLLVYLKIVPVRHRHFILLIPVSVTLVSLWLARTKTGVARAGSVAAVAVLLVGLLASFERYPQYPEDWRQVADYLAQRAAPGDRIVVFDPDRALPLEYYLAGRAAVVGLPTDADLEHYGPNEYAISDTTVLSTRLGAAGAGNLWLVEAVRLEPGLQPSVAVINGYVARHYRVGAPVRFRGVVVRHLEPRDGSVAAAS